MPLELHVWGPAFGLPSIDAECLAAIAYLHHCLAHQGWKVVPSSDPSVSPFGELPALKDGGRWVARFANIVTYLREVSSGDWDLDKQLTRDQRADCVAFTSFIESRGQPLLDLSFYVSSENYNSCTRSAFGKILVWPGSWTIPGQLRGKARKRSEHLGLSSLDFDAAQEQEGQDKGLSGQIPKSLRKPKQTVSALLGKHASKDRFRLDALSADFMEPVDDLLGQQPYLLGDAVSSLDCLAIGYLSLMQRPDLPHGWLKGNLRDKYTRLGTWSEKSSRAWFGQAAVWQQSEARTEATPDKDDAFLPWQQPAESTWSDTAVAVFESIVQLLPVIGRNRTALEIEDTPNNSNNTTLNAYDAKQNLVLGLRRNERLAQQMIGSAAGLGALLASMVWAGLLRLPRRTPSSGPRNFGEAGTLLGLG